MTHRLYTQDGTFLPHAECPMAEAIISKQSVRGVTAVAERPDGSRVAFATIPTPIIGEDGQPIGAINILVDVTQQQLAAFEFKSAQTRRLATGIGDARSTRSLLALAAELDARAAVLRTAPVSVNEMDDPSEPRRDALQARRETRDEGFKAYTRVKYFTRDELEALPEAD